MVKSVELKQFDADIAGDEGLRRKFADAYKRIAESDGDATKAEVYAQAAAEIGYSISLPEIERAQAEAQTLSDSELDAVAGGSIVGDIVCQFSYDWTATSADICNGNLHCSSNYACVSNQN